MRTNYTLACALALSALRCVGRPKHVSDPRAILLDCTPEMFVDMRAPDARRDVTFGGSPADFRPACLLVAPGQQVRFIGSFTPHPLVPGIAPGRDDPTPPGTNPIAHVTVGSVAAFTFPQLGLFPYYCEMHFETSGMVGVVIVREANAPFPDPEPDAGP